MRKKQKDGERGSNGIVVEEFRGLKEISWLRSGYWTACEDGLKNERIEKG